MIVTCESCKSRYKLDDAKITGRGAKITCPKCKAVFVVYAKDQAGAKPPDPASPPAAAPKPAPKPASAATQDDAAALARFSAAQTPARPDDWDDEPTRVGGDEHAPEAPRAPEARAPEARAAEPAAPAPSAPSIPTTSGSGVPIATSTGPATIDSATAAARAATLDFRAVGVTAWKVKVKIGLIYDFSDIKTLRKYIQDGRVTSSDVVSWDGKAWRAIGEIPDLDIYFVETWEMLAARKADPAGATLAPAPPTPDVQKVIEEAAAATRSGGEPNQFKDPFAEARRKQQDKADLKRTAPVPPPPPPKPVPPSRLPLFAVGIVILLGGVFGSMWWMQQQQQQQSTGGTGTVKPSAPSGADIREKLNEQLKEKLATQQGAPAEAAPAAPAEVATATIPGDDRELIPINRGAAPSGAATGVPTGATPVIPKGVTKAGPTMSQTDAGASDHEAVGDDAVASGDWGTAAQAYAKAAALSPRDAGLLAKLGRAQGKSGDGAAEGTLKKAGGMGAKEAWKWLGDYAAEQGDVPGAKGYYQQYLATKPRDAAEVQKKLDQLGGG